MAKRISTSEGLIFGLLLLGQVTAVLLVATLAGLAFDTLADTKPIGLAACGSIGSLTATIIVLRKVTAEFK